MLRNIWIWRMVLFLMHRKSSISNAVGLNIRFPLLSWQIQFRAKGIACLIKTKFQFLPRRLSAFPSLLLPSLSLSWVFWVGGFFFFFWRRGRGWAATILDINYNQEEGEKSSQVLSWLTEAAWNLWHSSSNIIFGVTWTWGLCKCKAKKEKKICSALTMHSVSDGFNYQND